MELSRTAKVEMVRELIARRCPGCHLRALVLVNGRIERVTPEDALGRDEVATLLWLVESPEGMLASAKTLRDLEVPTRPETSAGADPTSPTPEALRSIKQEFGEWATLRCRQSSALLSWVVEPEAAPGVVILEAATLSELFARVRSAGEEGGEGVWGLVAGAVERHRVAFKPPPGVVALRVVHAFVDVDRVRRLLPATQELFGRWGGGPWYSEAAVLGELVGGRDLPDEWVVKRAGKDVRRPTSTIGELLAELERDVQERATESRPVIGSVKTEILREVARVGDVRVRVGSSVVVVAVPASSGEARITREETAALGAALSVVGQERGS